MEEVMLYLSSISACWFLEFVSIFCCVVAEDLRSERKKSHQTTYEPGF